MAAPSALPASVASSIRNATALQFRVLLNLIQHPSELLLRGDDDGFPFLEETGQIVSLHRDADNVLEVSELIDVLPNVCIQRLSIGENQGDVDQLLVRAWLVEAVQPVSQPADRKRLAAASRVIG